MTGTDQLVSNADTSIARIQHQIAELSKQAKDCEIELAAIATGKDSRLSELQTARADVARLQGVYEQAVTYAKLAQDTPRASGATQDVSSAKKVLHAGQQKLAQLEAQDDKARQAEQVRGDELLDALNKARAEQVRLDQELHSIETVRAQASRQEAEQKQTSILQGYAEREARIDALRTQLIDAQVQLHDYHQDAVQALAEYPDLQRAVSERMPLDNATTRMIEATAWYVDALIDNAREVEENAQLASLRGAFGCISLWNVLLMQEGDIFNFIRSRAGQNPPPMLLKTQERIQKLLEEYRDSKKTV